MLTVATGGVLFKIRMLQQAKALKEIKIRDMAIKKMIPMEAKLIVNQMVL